MKNGVQSSPVLHLSVALAMGLMTVGLGYFVAQSSFFRIIGFYAPFFLLYLLVFKRLGGMRLYFWLGVAVVLRLILLFSMPALSDDVYRFIWDGRLLVHGYNPFDQLPGYYLEKDPGIPGINEDLFLKLNSPEYFTVYPPVAQATFALSVWFFPKSILGSVFLMKLFLFACELGVIGLISRLLSHFQLSRQRVLLYALNPLIIIEGTGNLHYEGAMIFFLLLSYWGLVKKRWNLSAAALALSIGSKLLPLMFLPFLIRRLGWRRSLHYFAVMSAVLVLLFLPLAGVGFLYHFGESLDLYFRKFEFNGSVYYIARWIGYQLAGYNLIFKIGPSLAMIVFAGILYFAFFDRDRSVRSLPSRWLYAVCLYLFLTTTVHPWYVSLPVVLGLFTSFRFPVLWSGLIFLTYINYSYNPYWENLWVVALEYLLVGGFLLGELLSRRDDLQKSMVLEGGGALDGNP